MEQAPIQSQVKRLKGIQFGGQRNKTSRRHRDDVAVFIRGSQTISL